MHAHSTHNINKCKKKKALKDKNRNFKDHGYQIKFYSYIN